MTNDEMSRNMQPRRRTRSQWYERTEQLFKARSMPEEKQPEEKTGAMQAVSYTEYTPNDPPSIYARPKAAPARSRRRSGNEQAIAEEASADPADISLRFVKQSSPADESWAAYRRPREETAQEETGEDQFAYAPPVRLSIAGRDAYDPFPEETSSAEEQSTHYAAASVYRPREIEYDALEDSQKDAGYQVQEEMQEIHNPAKKKGHPVLMTVLFLAATAAVIFLLFPNQIGGLLSGLFGGTPQQDSVPTIVATPAPQRSFDAASPAAISSLTGSAISRISGTVDMEPHIVKDNSILTRNRRQDGDYDFYLFSALDGRLLCYFEKLGLSDVMPLAEGGYYVRQSPYLINDDGTEMISVSALNGLMNGGWTLSRMSNGWAVITEEESGKMNLVNRDAQLLNRFWMSKLWPMTGTKTLGYVDTGNITDTESRYSLYLLDQNGDSEKWLSDGDMSTVVASACGAAYMKDGSLYLLDDTASPLLVTDEVRIYADCGAMVVRDPQSGKYGLYVQGKQHYDFLFDDIRPVEGSLVWHTDEYAGQGGNISLCHVFGAEYPQPLTHYFKLTNEGAEEFVALSTLSVCPVVLD